MIRTLKTLFEKEPKNCSSFIALWSRKLVIDVSLVLSVRVSQEGQNHLFWEDNVSLSRSLSKDVFILLDIGRGKMSHFSSFAAKQWQVLQVIVVLNVFETRSFAKTDVPLRLSKTNCNNSTGSCWELKSKETLRVSVILRLRAHWMFDRSIGFNAFLQDGHI